MKLKNGKEIFCGEYDLEPAEHGLSLMGYTGLLEEVQLRRVHLESGYCPSCNARHHGV